MSAACQLGGETTSGSGNQWHSKGDVKTRQLLVECKRTEKKSFRLTREMLRVLRLEALKAGRDPVLQLEFEREQWAIIPWDNLLALMELRSE